MPSKSNVLRWLNENAGFRDQYARAREAWADKLADEIVEISDESSGDEMTLKDGRVVCDNEYVQRSRLRVDSRKWVAARLSPKKYGDRVMQEITGAEGGAIEFNDIQRAARIATILADAKKRAGK